MAQYSCKNLSVGYENKVICGGFNFELERGDYLCIIGENGCGKSTLMKTMLGLIKPIHGEVGWGNDVKCKHIGYLTQQSEIQREFPATVQEVVMSGFQNKNKFSPFYNQSQKIEAKDWMDKLGIIHLAKKCYRELSGGQQQRVLLSRALCATHEMLFLDEPVAGLDPKATQDMYDLIAELNQKEKITMVMISHDVKAALQYASHVLHISEEITYTSKDRFIEKYKQEAFND